MKGCGKQIPAGFDRIRGYPLHNTCGFIVMGEAEFCEECKKKFIIEEKVE